MGDGAHADPRAGRRRLGGAPFAFFNEFAPFAFFNEFAPFAFFNEFALLRLL